MPFSDCPWHVSRQRQLSLSLEVVEKYEYGEEINIHVAKKAKQPIWIDLVPYHLGLYVIAPFLYTA